VRPVYAHHPQLQRDPHFRDYVLFYEYFHGDSGRGVGAAHQTGWTGLVAKLLMPRYAAESAVEPQIVQLSTAKSEAAPRIRVPRAKRVGGR